MSSAILYVAIVAIWACVLIPRWLRRDSSASVVAAQAEDETAADPVGSAEPAPVSAPLQSSLPSPSLPPPRRRRVEVPAVRSAGPDEVPNPVEPANRRVLSARRRLLMMLLALGVASGALAGTHMAAWWVVVPPSVMLLGYLLLLREAAKADAQQREMARYQMARAAAEAARAPARRPAPVPVASAGSVSAAKIFTIPAAPEPAEEEIYDQYADAKLRAVGD